MNSSVPIAETKNPPIGGFHLVSTKASVKALPDVFDQPKVMTLRKESQPRTTKAIMKVKGKFSNLNADIVFTSINLWKHFSASLFECHLPP